MVEVFGGLLERENGGRKLCLSANRGVKIHGTYFQAARYRGPTPPVASSCPKAPCWIDFRPRLNLIHRHA
jgi:hypothetical protein